MPLTQHDSSGSLNWHLGGWRLTARGFRGTNTDCMVPAVKTKAHFILNLKAKSNLDQSGSHDFSIAHGIRHQLNPIKILKHLVSYFHVMRTQVIRSGLNFGVYRQSQIFFCFLYSKHEYLTLPAIQLYHQRKLWLPLLFVLRPIPNLANLHCVNHSDVLRVNRAGFDNPLISFWWLTRAALQAHVSLSFTTKPERDQEVQTPG